MGNFGFTNEHGFKVQDDRLTPVYKKLSVLLMKKEIEIGNDGNFPDGPDTGEFAELTPPNQPPEIEGAEKDLPQGSKQARWAGSLVTSRA